MTTSTSPKKVTIRHTPQHRATRKRVIKISDGGQRQPGDVPQKQKSVYVQLGRPLGQSEQLIILVSALAFGLGGLAIRALWIVSILLMTLLLGLMAADVRNTRGRGIVSEVVNEAKVMVDEIRQPRTIDRDHSNSDSGSSSASP